jgi:hypothetical protein
MLDECYTAVPFFAARASARHACRQHSNADTSGVGGRSAIALCYASTRSSHDRPAGKNQCLISSSLCVYVFLQKKQNKKLKNKKHRR